jgi:ribosome-binding factor A
LRRRPTFTRAGRLGALMRDEVERVLAYEVRAAAAREVKVTDAVLSPDLGHLRVRYVMAASDEASEPVQEALERMAGFVARAMAEALQVHRPPRVVFSFDREYARLRKMQALLGQTAPADAAEASAAVADDDDRDDDDRDDDDDGPGAPPRPSDDLGAP